MESCWKSSQTSPLGQALDIGAFRDFGVLCWGANWMAVIATGLCDPQHGGVGVGRLLRGAECWKAHGSDDLCDDQ